MHTHTEWVWLWLYGYMAIWLYGNAGKDGNGDDVAGDGMLKYYLNSKHIHIYVGIYSTQNKKVKEKNLNFKYVYAI